MSTFNYRGFIRSDEDVYFSSGCDWLIRVETLGSIAAATGAVMYELVARFNVVSGSPGVPWMDPTVNSAASGNGEVLSDGGFRRHTETRESRWRGVNLQEQKSGATALFTPRHRDSRVSVCLRKPPSLRTSPLPLAAEFTVGSIHGTPGLPETTLKRATSSYMVLRAGWPESFCPSGPYNVDFAPAT
ncbi:hypothetical protein pipiens_012405 [Culex pipiens pipiens]|uniref:Uncharacterized protein n=1 Tax=Culex pipiens pipiens TaxID=38569 RepID=A0ABD1D311_CULPP